MAGYLKQIAGFVATCGQEEGDKALILDLCGKGADVLTRGNPVYHLTSSGLILNDTLDKILMIHHNIYNTWTWTGGHADGDADLEAVALREAREETGISEVRLLYMEMASFDNIPVFGHWKNGSYVCAHLHFNAAYLLQASEAERLVVRQEENSGVKWVPLEEAAAHSGEPVLIGIYGKMLARIGMSLDP
ncbi:MAG: NUDIX hydrolase [Clostridiales bacterium]|nr:NUDIX hydrolase [Clostridiales bacterium]